MTARPACRFPIISARAPRICLSLIEGMAAFDRGAAQRSMRWSPPRCSRSASSMFTRSRTATDESTAISFITCWRSAGSTRRRRVSGVGGDPRAHRRLPRVLEDYSQRLLPLIQWEPTTDGQCARAQRHRRFLPLLRCDAARGISLWLRAEDDRARICRAKPNSWGATTGSARGIETIVDMPDRTVDLLFRFLHQNEGTLSKRAREQEFASLTDD